MLHGVVTEAEAAESCLHDLRSAPGEESSVKLQTVGMYAHKQYPYLAASPDRLVIVTRKGRTSTHLLQIKSHLCQPQESQQLKPQFRKQVIGELAIVRSHHKEVRMISFFACFMKPLYLKMTFLPTETEVALNVPGHHTIELLVPSFSAI